MGNGLMRERIDEWKGGYGVLDEEKGVLEERGRRRRELKRGE